MRSKILFMGFLLSLPSYGEEALPETKPLKKEFRYVDRDISSSEALVHVGMVYGITWVLYPITQPDILLGKLGSKEEYQRNFGRLVFDQDEPFWNWFVHPISGSQAYLLYRGLGYTRKKAFFMTFVSSTLFEFTVEIYSEPASIQDLYQTPVFGSALGYGLELMSVSLINSDTGWQKAMGRMINPLSYFSHDAHLVASPTTWNQGKTMGLKLSWGF